MRGAPPFPPLCRAGNDDDENSYISETEDRFEEGMRARRELKERKKKAMQGARARAKTDKRAGVL